jgi:arabinan endo-1,5-alpha-L-arabinosidase
MRLSSTPPRPAAGPRQPAIPLPLAVALLVAAAVALLPAGFRPASAQPYPPPLPVRGNTVVHDPTIVKRPDGTYVMVTTGVGIDIRTSADRVTWGPGSRVFPQGAPWAHAYTAPDNPDHLWAPDISYHQGLYWLYYSASSFGSNHSAIFLATSPTAEPGSWTHRGLVYETTTASDHNAIDPNLVVDAKGRWWLSFGSFWTGIKMLRIDPATGLRSPKDPALYSLAERPNQGPIEAPFIYRHGGYYYLFVAFDFCCRGLDSTYRTMVGRSKHVTGPYVDRAGRRLLDDGGTEILSSHGDIIGPGHPAVLRDKGGDVLVYHYYDGADQGIPKLGLNLLGWDDHGWPYLR